MEFSRTRANGMEWCRARWLSVLSLKNQLSKFSFSKLSKFLFSKLSKFSFSNCQNFSFQTVKIFLFKLSKFLFSNCQNFPFQTVKIFLFKLSKFPFSNCQNFPFQTVKILYTVRRSNQENPHNLPMTSQCMKEIMKRPFSLNKKLREENLRNPSIIWF
jgi:hypothetical protein